MTFTVQELARVLPARVEGRGALRVGGLAEPAQAGPDMLAVALSPAYAQGLRQGRARAAVLYEGADWQALGLEAALFVQRPRLALARLTALWDPGGAGGTGQHPSALVDPAARLDRDVSVGPFAVIAAGARIGEQSVIGAHVLVGPGAHIGPGSVLDAGVQIGAGVRIGRDFRAHCGAVIGADGFSYVTAAPSMAETRDPGGLVLQPWQRIHSLGTVEIGDDVEIGANSTIDRGTLRATRIGTGTKIDNLVMVGHNARIGRHCLLCGQVGLAGSVEIGDGVVLGGQTGVKDHVRIGDHVITGAGTLVLSHVPSGRVLLGNPAQPLDRQIRQMRLLRRLGRLADDVAGLKKRVFKSGPKD